MLKSGILEKVSKIWTLNIDHSLSDLILQKLLSFQLPKYKIFKLSLKLKLIVS